MRLLKRLGLDQTRGQIFVGFTLAMVIVLLVTIGSLYVLLAGVQKKNVAEFADEIAVQMGGRLESLLSEINVLSLQLAMDDRIQERLLQDLSGGEASYEERMKIRRIMVDKTVYSETIQDMELFSLRSSIYPIVDRAIGERVDPEMVAKADESLRAGALVWMARDPQHPEFLLALRQIKLEKQEYAKGGYLLIRVKPSLVDFIGGERDVERLKGSIMYLFDEQNQLISAEGDGVQGLLDEREKTRDYMAVSHTIQETKWRLEIWLPKKNVTEDFRLIQTVMLWATLGCVLLFAVLSYSLSLFITHPLKKLTRVMQQGKEGTLKENPEGYFNREANQLNTKYNQMVRQMNHLIRSVYEIELLKSKSEITALHSQLNPHFLFNTLDSIYWAHIRKGEKELSHSIIRLADLFRYTIHSHGGGDGFVTLAEEIGQVRRYVDLMKLRWHDRLQVEIEVMPEAAACRIPKLTIQPLVENAIVHGIEPLDQGGMVTVRADVHQGILTVSIADNGVGMSEEHLQMINKRLRQETREELAVSSGGIGLYNVHKLVQLQYGERYGLELESTPGKGTIVKLVIAAEEGWTNEAPGHSGGR
ncbi:sensor histidine kinase [Paenibacillus sp. SYP-B4298]|uniref:sensor histidine kinase n=1 Tax=Paenibacillus sp. SYP-B4298 TaxID=2996034 RepID=UPI0022DD9CA7|nr:sensor histidine kinase [Paenibacillus sp. SYP-B4298]